jgi:hypothetical protein
MKTILGVMSLSIMSAIVGVFSAAELHEVKSAENGSSDAIRTTTADSTQPSQKIQQWVNY